MKAKWIPVAAVFGIAIIIVAVRIRSGSNQGDARIEHSLPRVLLVATHEEAVSPTRCGDIVRLVRAAAQRGVDVKELTPDSNSHLLSRYRVLTTPTVLVFGPEGTVRSRYEGETEETLTALRSEIQQMIQ